MGTGELARYVGNYGVDRIAKLVFLESLEPFLVRAEGNSAGVPRSVFDGIETAAKADRFAWFSDFYSNFYNLDETLGKRISQAAVNGAWNVAIGSALIWTHADEVNKALLPFVIA